MTPAIAKPITFIVPGQQFGGPRAPTRGAAGGSLPAGLRRGLLKQTVHVGAGRGGAGGVPVTAVPGEDVVVLQIAGGPSSCSTPNTRAI